MTVTICRALPIALLCATLPFVSSRPATNYVLHEKRTVTPTSWVVGGSPSPNTSLPMRIALRQSNLENAEAYLMNVSNPLSPTYGYYWTADEVISTFAPTGETVNAVQYWLQSNGLAVNRSSTAWKKGWLEFNASVAQAESLLKTKYNNYVDSSGRTALACDEYSIPESLQGYIDFVTPTVSLFSAWKPERRFQVINKDHAAMSLSPSNRDRLPTRRTTPWISNTTFTITLPEANTTVDSSLSGCDSNITPDCVRALYAFPSSIPSNNNNSYAVVEYGNAYVQNDLDVFFQSYAPQLVGQSPKLDAIGDATAPGTSEGGDADEANLDIEYAMALVYPQEITLYQVGDDSSWTDAVNASSCGSSTADCGEYPAANVISVSYGGLEAGTSTLALQRECQEYLKLGLQGVTVLFASGDSGVAGNGQCLDSNGNVDGTTFTPTFPASCPWITAVGATQIDSGSTVNDPESAAAANLGGSYFYSGGGFSNVFSIPDYQRSAVENYLNTTAPSYSSSVFNRSGRAYPDVSANGVNIVVGEDGELTDIFGTSASTPIFGSVITLLNAERLNAGKSSLGFLNTALYSNASVLHDITSGSNPGCGTNGFSTAVGWDPVTGLETPDYPSMLAYFMNL